MTGRVRHFSSKVLHLGTMNQSVREAEYAVRGLVPALADKIHQDILANPQYANSKYPFPDVLFCNIGNPQAVGQKPLSFFRDVLSLIENPRLLEHTGIFDDYVIDRAKRILRDLEGHGTGAYSHSLGVHNFRKHVCKFIEQRDKIEASTCNEENVFLTNGASDAIHNLLMLLIANKNDGVLIPVPQYPIYSAVTKMMDGKFVGYYLEEENRWGLDRKDLHDRIVKAKDSGVNVKAMVIINPGNPVGSVLTRSDIEHVIETCRQHKMVLLADEVYQENIYDMNRPFISARRVLLEMEAKDPSLVGKVELASFHSTSKGFLGECGKRGGYMDLLNFDPDIIAQLTKIFSSELCSNIIGQALVSLMVSPPTDPSSETYHLFNRQKTEVLGALKEKSALLHKKLNSIKGVSCQPLDGAMYAFPKLTIGKKFQDEAKKLNLHPDAHYALSLLKNTGLCTVPGSGFNQRDGTFHIRMTFLPEKQKLSEALDKFAQHHINIVNA